MPTAARRSGAATARKSARLSRTLPPAHRPRPRHLLILRRHNGAPRRVAAILAAPRNCVPVRHVMIHAPHSHTHHARSRAPTQSQTGASEQPISSNQGAEKLQNSALLDQADTRCHHVAALSAPARYLCPSLTRPARHTSSATSNASPTAAIPIAASPEQAVQSNPVYVRSPRPALYSLRSATRPHINLWIPGSREKRAPE